MYKGVCVGGWGGGLGGGGGGVWGGFALLILSHFS